MSDHLKRVCKTEGCDGIVYQPIFLASEKKYCSECKDE